MELQVLNSDDALPELYNCARYVGGAQLDTDTETPNGAAFRLREDKQEEYLSTSCLELTGESEREEQIEALRKIYEARDDFRVGATSKFAVFEVASMKHSVMKESEDSRKLDVRYKPEPHDQTHTGVYGLRFDDDVIADLMAQCVSEVYSAKG